MPVFEPKFISVIKEGYTKKQFGRDAVSGVLVGIVALPLAIAFAIASGVSPEQGIFTAVIAGFLISLLSGSRVQIGGPTGAFIVIVFGIIQKYGYDGLATATLIAGVLLIIMGLARLGSVIKFIPYPVTVGFTGGIALIIFITQIKDFLGLTIETVPGDFIGKISVYAGNISTINYWALGIGALALAIILLWPKVTYKIPGSLIAIIVTTLLTQLFNIPVETIGSRFGGVPNMLPVPKLPNISFEMIKTMFVPGMTIAMLAGIESLLSAVVADGMLGTRHRSNMELVAIGVANIFSPLFGGLPATGAIARTATNIKNGGRTPVAGIIHAITLLLIMIFFGKWAALIPMSALAAILMVVAVNMSEMRLFIKLFKSPRMDILVLLTTFLLTVLVDLTVAIEVGVVLAAILFMYRMSEVTQTKHINKKLEEGEEFDDPKAINKKIVPRGVEVFEILGSFFFGAADKFKDELKHLKHTPVALILRMRDVYTIDATGLRALEDVYEKSKSEKTALILSGVHAQPLYALEHCGLFDKIGKENIFKDIDDALERSKQIIEDKSAK